MFKKRFKRTLRYSRYIYYKETLVNREEKFWSFLGSFIGIGIIAFWQSHALQDSDSLFLIGSFGASSVLVYGIIQSPLAQPRNLIGGHLVSAFIGVSIQLLLPDIIWITAPLAVSLSIIAMQFTKTLHPPGGATALLAVIGSDKIKLLGYTYIFFPVLSGALVLLLVALVFNNITPKRSYPINRNYKKRIRKLLLLR
ncbi:HPP family protein [Flavihumibacter sp. CACIAM 22H1]|uniref:HPP family protein n=1 Tax=Flavihumibacter sp. CACIAM 22H1 TaxID=1812911 RepID=UPI0007A898B1|nr:HPP family protein [Flavihumibacter sp. CACIAM 22H1]KYP14883.1 MAG: HPP family protein [Flavihumibacter sp. CACIAM 22H1]